MLRWRRQPPARPLGHGSHLPHGLRASHPEVARLVQGLQRSHRGGPGEPRQGLGGLHRLPLLHRG
eukprot:4160799-Alexandrium_andersonii.AAC.1